ncbi:hypothetical protein [Saccharopolyspora sp. NPDC002376]
MDDSHRDAEHRPNGPSRNTTRQYRTRRTIRTAPSHQSASRLDTISFTKRPTGHQGTKSPRSRCTALRVPGERLPAYAPDLYLAEALWPNIKGVELANLCPDTIDEAITLAKHGASTASAQPSTCSTRSSNTPDYRPKTRRSARK